MIYNQKYLIILGIFFFAIAFASSYLVVDYSWDNSWSPLPWWGKLAAVLVVVDLAWLIGSMFIKNR